MIALAFDTFSLQGNGVVTTSTDIYSPPSRSIDAQKPANADGAVMVKSTFDPKVFTCSGYMKADTQSDLDILIDHFNRAMNKVNQNFDIDHAGGTRRYMATPQNIMISRPKGLNTAQWSVEFYCALPVGSDTGSSTLLASTNTTNSALTAPIDVSGSYKAEPVITVTINSVTGGTTKSISISNDATLRGLTVTRTWTAGDVLEIDCLNKTVYVNNATTQFSGQFPVWQPGNGGIGYLDDFTTRSVDVAANYTKRFL